MLLQKTTQQKRLFLRSKTKKASPPMEPAAPPFTTVNSFALSMFAMTKESTLTVEGELNKLASNISIGRDWAGVHYFTDYIESIRMGEQIAL
ncbi:MAG: hypothetical protein EP343_10515, partial [Deltaproteobacteria bacterium]